VEGRSAAFSRGPSTDIEASGDREEEIC